MAFSIRSQIEGSYNHLVVELVADRLSLLTIPHTAAAVTTGMSSFTVIGKCWDWSSHLS